MSSTEVQESGVRGQESGANGQEPDRGGAECTVQSAESRNPLPWTLQAALGRTEQLLDHLGDFLNPILVKEARQAMKSRQFSVTFALLLILGWLWTVGFIAYWNISLYYQSYGAYAITVYYVVLTIPMLIVIPFATFRSLASETEDGTFELMSITSLSARQIVLGKLASAVLQMLVYYSALAPCIAFTYLLRGIDIVTIGMMLLHTFLGSVLLSSVGLAAATLSRSRMWQVLVSVLLIMALMLATWFWNFVTFLFIFEPPPDFPSSDQPFFWAIHGTNISFMAAFSVLFLFVAAAQITFASENRSTPIRLVLVAIQFLLVGSAVHMWRVFPESRPDYWLIIMEFLAGIFWMVTGAILTGETAELSPRAKRNLPQSLLGKSLLTWFNPGSASGYIFTVLNLAGVVLTHVLVVGLTAALGDKRAPPDWEWVYIGIAILGYVAGYLGIVRLCVVVARRYTAVPMLTVFLMHVVVALMGVLIPLAILSFQYNLSAYDFSYSPLQITNWVWTLFELTRTGTTGVVGAFIPLVILLVGGFIFVVNLVDASVEVEKVRTVAPQRVLEDDAAQRPVEVHKPKNPWDDGTGKEVRDQRSEVRGVEPPKS